MFGEHESASNKEHAQGIAAEACRDELLSDLVTYIGVLDFETRKDVVQIFCALIRITLEDGRQPGKEYVLSHPDVLSTLFYGCAASRLGGPGRSHDAHAPRRGARSAWLGRRRQGKAGPCPDGRHAMPLPASLKPALPNPVPRLPPLCPADTRILRLR